MKDRQQIEEWSPDGAGWYYDGLNVDGAPMCSHVEVNEDYGVEVHYGTQDYQGEVLLSVEIITALLGELGYDVIKRST